MRIEEDLSKKAWFGIWCGVVLVFGLIGLAIFRMFFVTMVDNYEFAFNYNRVTGTVEKIGRTGWVVRSPFIHAVHTLDTRPYQISITANIQRNLASSGQGGVSARVLNAKLVRFNPAGLETFIEWHGRSAGDDLDNMLEILKAYAFNQNGGRDCPFLTIVDELSPRQLPQTANTPSSR